MSRTWLLCPHLDGTAGHMRTLALTNAPGSILIYVNTEYNSCWRSTVHSGLPRLYGHILIHSVLFTFNSIVVGHKCICPFHSFFPQFSYLRLRFVYFFTHFNSFSFTL